MLLFYSPFPWEKAMACSYKLGFEEFIIMNKMFVQIFVLLNNFLFNVLCCCVLSSRVYLYKLIFSKNKDANRSSIMCKMLSKNIIFISRGGGGGSGTAKVKSWNQMDS